MTFLQPKSLPTTPSINIKEMNQSTNNTSTQDYFSLKPKLSLDMSTSSKSSYHSDHSENEEDEDDVEDLESTEFDETKTENIDNIIDSFNQISIINHQDHIKHQHELNNNSQNEEIFYSPITPFETLEQEDPNNIKQHQPNLPSKYMNLSLSNIIPIPKQLKSRSRSSSPQLSTPPSPTNTNNNTSTNSTSPTKFKLNFPNLSTYNFLIVDDNIINLKILNRILSKIYPKSNITQIQDSTKIPQLLEDNLYDSIFIDIEMPKLNGFQIAKIIRNYKKFNKTSLIAVTTRNSPQDLLVFQNLGIDYTFNKPLNYKLEFMSNIIDNLMKFRQKNDINNINNYFQTSGGNDSTKSSISSISSNSTITQSDLMSNISSSSSSSLITCSCTK
ncbi:SRR1 [Candida pseudojiufengensis]|uniref:SRR1 n=1 Tax=Candida pseudojiufengensis TaxID=497109 RepID=UPI002224AE6E|nr:SRR1 [Candida pseudojiufengensis]KAI5962500.1 SRR1 [Candida pseudojiufengensis]